MKKDLIPSSLVTLTSTKGTYTGLIMPNSSATTTFLKLESGYTIGIARKSITKIQLLPQKKGSEEKKMIIPKKEGLPTILVIHTGGTIASKVDYQSGAVTTKFSAEDLIAMFPEVSQIANIKTVTVANIWSQDMRVEDYTIIAETVKKHYKEVQGIIIGHGTDTLHYSSAALAFMLEHIPIPILLVGAQRSSDRGSSDAGMNLVCAAEFINKTYFKGVAVCMHETPSDTTCVILPATKTRKLHTSRRDAFQPINAKPIARVNYQTRTVTMLDKQSNGKGVPVFRTKMEQKVGIVRTYPNMNPKILKAFVGYKGLIMEGTGLGHMPMAGKNKVLFDEVKKLLKKGMIVVMTSQCIFGRVNLNVYTPQRQMQEVGIISGQDMTTETAFVKLSWLLANFKKNELKELFQKNLRGELEERILPDEFVKELND